MKNKINRSFDVSRCSREVQEPAGVKGTQAKACGCKGCRRVKFIAMFLFLVFFTCTAKANNLSITNVTLENITASTIDVEFDISWENSWRDSGAPSTTANWDAAWLFIKFSTAADVWSHATLSGSGHNAPTGSQINLGLTSGATVGAFIYRNSESSGTVNWADAVLRWDISADGVSSDQEIAVKVFGIEMVYISSGAFYVGSGGTGTSEFYTYPNTANEYLISSEAAITVGTTDGNLYYSASTNGGDQTGTIYADFPKGFNAFYIMKTEISQRQYCDFLNTLTAAQSENRVYSSGYFNQKRNWIKKATNGKYGCDANDTVTTWGNAEYADMNESDDGGWTACNYLSWTDVTAYADWSGLRPFTELEFEKACRGCQLPLAGEHAWGSTSITQATGISNDKTILEGPSNSSANCVYNADASVEGPLRSGCMARAATTKEQAGAGYFGVLDLTGNLYERPVTVGRIAGRNFTGLHGNGKLDSSGDADVSYWPDSDAVGCGFRGGSWNYTSSLVQVSCRFNAAYASNFRFNYYGGRCARTSP